MQARRLSTLPAIGALALIYFVAGKLGLQLAFVNALNDILLIGGIVALTGALLGLLLVRSRDFAHGAEPAPAAA